MASSRQNPAAEKAPKQEGKDKAMVSKDSTNGNVAADSAPSLSDQTSSPSPRNLKRASTTPLLSSTTSSTTASPRLSREGSPVRPPMKPGIAAATRATNRSRKNSSDLSPHRAPSAPGPSIPTVPSAAAIQRALSAAGTPHLPTPAHRDATTDISHPPKVGKTANSSASRTGPSTSRVSSPPPTGSSGSNKTAVSTTRKIDQSQVPSPTPTIVVERPSKASTTNTSTDSDVADDDPPPKSGMRTPVRGISGNGLGLETVQESSLPATPSIGATVGKIGAGESSDTIEENPMDDALPKGSKAKPADSGSESAGNKNADVKSGEEGRSVKKPATAATSSRPPTVQSKRSFTQLPPKGKTPGEGSVKNMTVETETVSSIPQVALGGGAIERNIANRTDTGGSLRLKPSNETIRPKKEKKKVVRKAPSINQGTGGSSSRFSHHHHLSSRAPPPTCSISYSVSPSGSAFGRWSKSFEPSPRPWSRDQRDKHHRQSASESANRAEYLLQDRPGFKKRASSFHARSLTTSALTPFRGRPASSKADIFEAKVASAVGEADSSDSEETFVYESNPPEPHSGRPQRFHSRTPSAASTVSQIDYHKRQDGHHSVVGKKSMKFANNYNSIGYSNDGEGTVRGPSQAGRGTTSHHHIGRYGRGGHTSLFDNESPFPNATKPPRSVTGHLSNPSPRQSPRNGHFSKLNGSRKSEEVLSYDLEGSAADDERTPLVGSIRSGRTRRRPLPGSTRPMYATEYENSRLCSRVTAFTALGSVLAILIAAIVVIMIMCTKPLYEVHISDIRNVLASEQEIMLDLHVHAINPNLITVQVSDLDVNIFAKSKHVGTTDQWRAAHPQHPPSLLPPTAQPLVAGPKPHDLSIVDDIEDMISHLFDGGVDEGNDPIGNDPASDSQKMLLGQIFSFDSPLVFEPSPIKRNSFGSNGEVRLAKPGNRTEEGGSQRWERVLQHDFELIVRGVLKYTTPITQSERRASIAGSVIVRPSLEDKAGNSNTTKPGKSGRKGVALGSNVVVKQPEEKVGTGLRKRLFWA